MNPSDYQLPDIFKTDSNGYLLFTDKNHPLAYQSNYRVYLHRHIVSVRENRWLNNDEHVHHIDGNKKNNLLNNLQLMDKAEHAKFHNKKQFQICKICNITFIPSFSEIFCSMDCKKRDISFLPFNNGKTKADWPLPEVIAKMVWEMPTTHIGNKLGVSDKAVDKFCKKHNITKPPRGYWGRGLKISS